MSLYRSILRPLLFNVSAESAHECGIAFLRYGLGSRAARNAAANRYSVEGLGPLERFGLSFANPLGIAAGFDKNGVVARQLGSLGFGFVEVGTVTPRPQTGNEKPRLFRLPEDSALINRLGFNNKGIDELVARVGDARPDCVLGINIGKNKDTPLEDAIGDYLKCFRAARETADYIAVNVSSPNTPGLRDLQGLDSLSDLLGEIRKADDGEKRVPVLLKIAPDLSRDEVEAISGLALEQGIEGIIATNTTISREGLRTGGEILDSIGAGGLSGAPLKQMSDRVISWIFRSTRGKLPIVGVGGIFSGDDAFAKIAAGASLLQAYTGLVYEGPGFARAVNRRLREILDERGLGTIDEAVGTSVT